VRANLIGPIFFWLDAHFPGADGGLLDYNAEADESVRCPLESELEVISKGRPAAGDVILIDDLRIYENGPFEHGDMAPDIRRPPGNGIDFIYRLFGDTHHIIKLYYDEGYVLLLPDNGMPKIYARRPLKKAHQGEVASLIARDSIVPTDAMDSRDSPDSLDSLDSQDPPDSIDPTDSIDSKDPID
jgi:hypothetical protein